MRRNGLEVKTGLKGGNNYFLKNNETTFQGLATWFPALCMPV